MEIGDVAVRIGEIAPDFEQDTTNGSIRFHEWMSRSWCILFSQPMDFTSTSTMELSAAARLRPQWVRCGVKVVALSVDTPDGHARWEKAIAETEGLALNFPSSPIPIAACRHSTTWCRPTTIHRRSCAASMSSIPTSVSD